MEIGKWWVEDKEKKVRCTLCPHHCLISSGKSGICNVRKNKGGQLYSLVYGHPAALNVDPIEKKPLYHFYRGSQALSIGTVGCNLTCKFCQNWQLARGEFRKQRQAMSPEEIVKLARKKNCDSIAFTYNEPTIFGEYLLDISKIAHQQDIKTIMVTNGFITEEAVNDIYPHIDAANVDIKFFTDELYREYTGGRLQAILDAILAMQKHGTFIEITNLIIPELNDSPKEFKEFINWIKENLGDETPLHLSAFHPAYKMKDHPSTSKNQLDTLYEIAKKQGLKYIYEGNVRSDEHNNTYCPACGNLLIERSYFSVTKNNIKEGHCECGKGINVVNQH